MKWDKIFTIFSCIFIGLLMLGINVITVIGIYSDVTSNHVTGATIIVPLAVFFLDISAILLCLAVGEL